MKSKQTKCIITAIGNVESSTKGAGTRKQVLYLTERGFQHKTDATKNGVDNFYAVNIYNDKIEKFELAKRFQVGQSVTVEIWINGAIIKSAQGDKNENSLALASIEPA
jgi:hypothetical protein